jgi:hypothetical protein
MPTVAVVAHAGKSLGGGLRELREILAREGFTDPLWYEVTKSRKAPKYARRALARGAEVIFVWGGDGMVQRCVDAVAGTDAVLAILPAGTANLLAKNLHVPDDLTEAVRVGLHGERRPMDTGSVNGEHFAVMAGAGFDARMIKEADRGMKNRMGRAAYLYTGARNLSARRVKAVVEVDGRRFSRAGPRASWSGMWAKSSAESRPSTGHSRTTGSWNSAWSLRRIRLSGPGRWDGWRWAAPRSRRSSRSRTVNGSGSGLIGDLPTSWTVVRGRLSRRCGSRSIPPRSRSASPAKRRTGPWASRPDFWRPLTPEIQPAVPGRARTHHELSASADPHVPGRMRPGMRGLRVGLPRTVVARLAFRWE